MKLGIVEKSLVEGIFLTIIGFAYLYGFATNKNWAYHLLSSSLPRFVARVLGTIIGLGLLTVGIEHLFSLSRIFSGLG